MPEGTTHRVPQMAWGRQMSFDSDMDDSARRIEEATKLFDGGPVDFAHGTVKGLVAIADGARSCVAHPFEFAKGLWELWSE